MKLTSDKKWKIVKSAQKLAENKFLYKLDYSNLVSQRSFLGHVCSLKFIGN